MAQCKICANCKYLGYVTRVSLELDLVLRRCEFWSEPTLPQETCIKWMSAELDSVVVKEMLEFQKSNLIKEVNKLDTLIKDLSGESK